MNTSLTVCVIEREGGRNAPGERAKPRATEDQEHTRTTNKYQFTSLNINYVLDAQHHDGRNLYSKDEASFLQNSNALQLEEESMPQQSSRRTGRRDIASEMSHLGGDTRNLQEEMLIVGATDGTDRLPGIPERDSSPQLGPEVTSGFSALTCY